MFIEFSGQLVNLAYMQTLKKDIENGTITYSLAIGMAYPVPYPLVENFDTEGSLEQRYKEISDLLKSRY